MLIRARDVNANYTPPTAYAIGGPLLESTFVAYYDKSKAKLLEEASTFGISMPRAASSQNQRGLRKAKMKSLRVTHNIAAMCDRRYVCKTCCHGILMGTYPNQ
jgi:hypothetical protein